MGTIVSYGQNIVSPKPETPVVAGYAYVQFAGAKFFDISKVTSARTGNAEVDAYFDEIGVTKISPFDPNPNLDAISRRNGIDRMFTLEFSVTEMSSRQAVDGLLRLKAVKSASPCYLFSACYTPNDTHVGEQYALTKMNVFQAWNSTHGDPNVVIAIVDDGINYNHEDLAANIATNPGEMGLDILGNDKRSNGIDDDLDGYKDNWRGWDFIGKGTADSSKTWVPDNDPAPPIPGNSHGTHVAGCASAATDNGKGVSAPGFNCKIMPLKSGDYKNTLGAGYQGIEYAATHGARVINCSWGGSINPADVHFAQAIIDNAVDHGALVVAAAGNDASDNDKTPFFPASLDNVLSVGASDQNDKAASFSNFGNSVKVFAPGAGIYTIGVPDNNSYDPGFGGTSAASPGAAGVCGLLFSIFPDWTPQLVIRKLVETADNVVNPANRAKYWGRINAGNAISKPGSPGLVVKGYKVDGEADASLDFIKKKYHLTVTFKNVASQGSNVQAILLTRGGYSVSLSTAQLGTMETGKETDGAFEFTRDGNDDGSTLHLFFYVVSGTTYKDTLRLDIPISGSDVWIEKAVKNQIEGASFGECFPNPAMESVTVPFTLSGAEDVAIGVTDILGRNMYARNAELFDAGIHRLNIDTRKFSEGMYYITLTLGNGKRFSGQFVIVQ